MSDTSTPRPDLASAAPAPMGPGASPASTAPEAASVAPPVSEAPASAPPVQATQALPGRWIAAGAVVLTAIAVASLTLAWNTQQRVKQAEQELIKRQQEAGGQSAEAHTLAAQAQATSREAAAKVTLLEARLAETSLQRTQIEELIQSLSRSRDENLLADLDAAVRVAQQQSALTGSSEPLAAALRQADERLARYQQPRLDRVRRAVLQDIELLKAAGGLDLPSLSLRVDEAIRLVDDLPLVSATDRKPGRAEPNSGAGTQPPASPQAPSAGTKPGAGPARQVGGAAEPAPAAPRTWGQQAADIAHAVASRVWEEARSLLRVTRIDHPEAALLAPEQAFFLRENVKLRLLNVRLSIMSRQFDLAQNDLREAQATIDRYFDRSSRRVVATSDLLRQVAAQTRQVQVPRPDATLAALATALAGR